jgi:hypothetical protein
MKGKGEVHLSGYFEPAEDEGSDMDDEDMDIS